MKNFEEKNRSVLVVDDEDDILAAMKEIIEDLGYEATTSTNAKEALSLCSNKEFDAILSDINMPELSGFDFLAQIKVNQISSPVIFITASGADKKNTTSAIRLGAFDYIEKPWQKSELEEMLSMATEFGMRRRRLNYLNGIPESTLTPGDIKQIESDRKFLALGPVVYNKKRNQA